MSYIKEPPRKTKIIGEADVCVVGGSCTGVFAAVRAARLGASVVIIERHNCFGGMATAGMVNIWHSLFDNRNDKQIIAGLTLETIERLKKRNAVDSFQESLKENEHNAYLLNTEELKIELDEIVRENGIIPYLNTLFVCPAMGGEGTAEAVIVENKGGRGAIKAKMFIDATGDGDLARKMGMGFYSYSRLQPPTMCAKIYGLGTAGNDWKKLISGHKEEFGLKEDWGWESGVPEMPKLTLCAETHVFGANCADAQELTFSEMEGRRQIRAYMDILRKYGPEGTGVALAALASSIGIRDTWHIECAHKVSEDELLRGASYDDAVAFGSYRIDVHHTNGAGITFKYLNGVQETTDESCAEPRIGRWGDMPNGYRPYYQIPYGCITPRGSRNMITAGRMLDADENAFGALRVMVLLNQMGEAAGTAAFLALDDDCDIHGIDIVKLRDTMKRNGSIML